MNSKLIWGKHSPLSALSGAGLLIMASSRLAFAVFCSGGILWVYSLTALLFYSAEKFMPRKGKFFIYLFFISLFCSMYILIMSFLNPILLSASWFFLVLIPPCFIGSRLFAASETREIEIQEILLKIAVEAAFLCILLIAISLIREPLGIGSLSFPGGSYGIIEIFSPREDGEGFVPIRLLSASAGGLLILGLCVSAFQYLKNQISHREDE